MYRIGEFSTLSKTTIKTLRYYEKEGLLIPSYVDKMTNYRFYETGQLITLAKIVQLRQIGMSIDNIKSFLKGNDTNNILDKRKKELESELEICNEQILRINYLLEGRNMEKEIVVKELPDYTVYYKEGIIDNFSCITDFILSSADECRKTNPNIKCVEPGYCYVSYLDGEYKDKDIKIRYAQAVLESGIPNETIKFEHLKPVKAATIYHKGDYSRLGEAYGTILKWVEENNYEIIDAIRERYIDGMWNKDSVDEWLTEIQVPIRKKD